MLRCAVAGGVAYGANAIGGKWHPTKTLKIIVMLLMLFMLSGNFDSCAVTMSRSAAALAAAHGPRTGSSSTGVAAASQPMTTSR